MPKTKPKAVKAVKETKAWAILCGKDIMEIQWTRAAAKFTCEDQYFDCPARNIRRVSIRVID